MIINGKKVKTNGYFAYEGCHKMYVCESDADVEMMRGYGYDILPIAELPKTYKQSCPLRFINSANLKTTYCPQCREAKFSESEVSK